MKRPLKFILAGTPALFAAALCLQAQTSTSTQPRSGTSSSSSTASPSSSAPSSGSSSSSVSPSSSSAQSGATSGASSSSTASPTNRDQSATSAPTSSASASGSFSGSGSAAASGSLSTSNTSTNPSQAQTPSSTTATSDTANPTTSGTQSNLQANAQQSANIQQSTTQSTQSVASTSTQIDTQVTTVVQQIDSAGPVVVERISTQFADLACTPDNARMLVDAIHNGTSVTLSANGRSATFTVTGSLGYGETYIALSLAAEALRQAGITGCATPEQWQAVLLGGPLSGASTTTTITSRSASASSTSNFPGILVLHSRGQGWGQVAQQTHVELGQVISSANSSLSLNSSANSTSEQKLAPTGRTSAEMDKSRFPDHSGQDANKLNAHPSANQKDRDHEKDANDDKNDSSKSDDSSKSGKDQNEQPQPQSSAKPSDR